MSLPSLLFDDNQQTGFSANENSISITTNGAGRVLVDNNGCVTINSPISGSALTIEDGGAQVGGDISNSGNLLFNTALNALNAVGSTQGAGVKIFTGTVNSGVSASVTINYASAGFINPPVICANPINGINVSITINSITNTAAVIQSGSALNVPLNYIAIGI